MFSAQVQGLDRLRGRVAGLGKQVRYASARALNSAAFDVRLAVQDKMRQVFDRPTAYILRSIWVDRAEPARLEARVRPRYLGGKGVDPAAVLQAEVLGGQRRNTRAERALQAAGILPRGFAMVPAKWIAESAAHGDGNGNVKGSFIVRLLAYFKAFGEQGYRANMNDRGRKRLAKFGRSESGSRKIRGVVYFVSRGRGEFTGRGAWRNGRQQHLAAGIWQKSGTHGVDLKPVFLFVRLPRYRVRLDPWAVAGQVMAQRFPVHFQRELAHALATAR